MKRNLLTEGGALNSNGEYFIGYFKTALRDILEETRDAEFSAEELALLGSILQARVGTAITAEISQLKVKKNRQENHPLWQMSDDEFMAFFNSKYDTKNLFTIVAPSEDASYEDELARYHEVIGRQVQAWLKNPPMYNTFSYPQGKDRF